MTFGPPGRRFTAHSQHFPVTKYDRPLTWGEPGALPGIRARVAVRSRSSPARIFTGEIGMDAFAAFPPIPDVSPADWRPDSPMHSPAWRWLRARWLHETEGAGLVPVRRSVRGRGPGLPRQAGEARDRPGQAEAGPPRPGDPGRPRTRTRPGTAASGRAGGVPPDRGVLHRDRPQARTSPPRSSRPITRSSSRSVIVPRNATGSPAMRSVPAPGTTTRGRTPSGSGSTVRFPAAPACWSS